MNTSRLPLFILAALLRPIGAPAAVVTLCAVDTQVSAGGNTMNLQSAMEIGGVITFACGGPATIRLTRTYTIQRDTDIEGGGTVTLDGGHSFFGMFFGVSDAVSLTMTRINIINGGRFARPGEITIGKVHGNVVSGHFSFVQLITVSVEQSVWPVWLTSGSLSVNECRFSNNDGSVLIGASIDVRNQSVFTHNRGSTIWSEGGEVAIADSQFISNTGPVVALKGKLKIIHSAFTGNANGGDGGALRVGSDATIEESDFNNNAAHNGGALFIEGNTGAVSLRALNFYNNGALSSGGAIGFGKSPVPLVLTMQHITFQGNLANQGGAMMLDRGGPSHTIVNGGAVAFIGNNAGNSGGAIFAPNADIQLTRGVFVDNRAGQTGGAIAAAEQNDSKVSLANSMLVSNTAPQGSAFWGNRVIFLNSTIADNTGIPVWPQVTPPDPALGTSPFFLRFVNSIVSSNFTASCGPAVASIPYLGHNNIEFPLASCGAGFARTNPYLGPYYVPFFWSAALGAGDNLICDAAPVSHKDVYNGRRPLGRSGCSIGAVEGDIQHLIHRWFPPNRDFRR